MAETTRARLLRHARFTEAIRAYFSSRCYVEVETPTLAPFLIPEPSLEVFRTEYQPWKPGGRELWLVPSPELWMKRLLGAGSGNIFQISRCFRNGDFANPVHNPEFRLLEWYTVESGYLESVAVVEDLFAHLLEATAGAPPRGALQPPFLRLTMAEAFQMHAGIDLASCSETEKLASEGRRQGLTLPSDLTWEVAFHMIFLTLVEPNLPREKPLALLDYPALIPTTARRKPGTPWAERWELYVDGVEIANCYTEETDHGVLERLFEAEAKRKEGCRVRHRVDVGLTGAFPAGFPRCSGGAMGVDRLEMIFFNEKTLEGVIPFPFSAIVKGNT